MKSVNSINIPIWGGNFVNFQMMQNWKKQRKKKKKKKKKNQFDILMFSFSFI
jgi:hypothetical protein